MFRMLERSPGSTGFAEAIFAAEDELLALGCRRDRLSFADLLADPAHASIYDVNCLRNVRGAPTWPQLESGFTRVIAATGGRHRRLVSRTPETIRHLDALLLPRSFTRQACVAMALPSAPGEAAVPDGLEVEIVGEADRKRLQAVNHCQDLVRRDEPWYAPEVSRQMDEMAFRQMQEGGAEFVAAVDPYGQVAGALLLLCREGVGFIADVGTAPMWRRRGVASGLVVAAANLARAQGCNLVGLTARRDESPRHLYSRLGFQVVGESIDWLKGS